MIRSLFAWIIFFLLTKRTGVSLSFSSWNVVVFQIIRIGNQLCLRFLSLAAVNPIANVTSPITWTFIHRWVMFSFWHFFCFIFLFILLPPPSTGVSGCCEFLGWLASYNCCRCCWWLLYCGTLGHPLLVLPRPCAPITFVRVRVKPLENDNTHVLLPPKNLVLPSFNFSGHFSQCANQKAPPTAHTVTNVPSTPWLLCLLMLKERSEIYRAPPIRKKTAPFFIEKWKMKG